MTNLTKGKRLLLLVLAFLFVLNAMPGHAFANSITYTDDYTSHIGGTAVFNPESTLYAYIADEPADNWTSADMVFDASQYGDLVMIVEDYYKGESGLWYKVKAAEGYTLPEDMAKYPWIYQNEWDSEDYADALIVTPADPSVGMTVNGESVTEATVTLKDKVTVKATPNMQGTTTYQWQILISAADLWVNIANSNTAECVINYGMVANRLDAEGKVYIRCVTTVNGVEIISDPIAVMLGEITEEKLFQSFNGSLNSDLSENSENTDGKYYVNVYCYIGDSDVPYGGVQAMEFGVEEDAQDVSFDVTAMEGYTPYYFGTSTLTGKENGTIITTTDNKYTLENFKPESNMTLIIRYYPNEDTPYKVEHYIQNIHDDDYELYKVENKEGTTDEKVPAFDTEGSLVLAELEAQGFYAIPYQCVSIASDGSTVIQIRYDRYMYLMLFDLGEGGMGVEPIYARVGFKYEVANEPTRRGYAFDGWKKGDGTLIHKDAKPYVFEVTTNITMITALWREHNTTYTIVYWKENADPDKDENGKIVRDSNGDPVYSYSYWAHAVVPSFTGSVVHGTGNITKTTDVTDEEVKYFTFNNVATDKNVVVKGNGSTVVNVYYLRNYYEIYFYGHGSNNSNAPTGCAVTHHTHDDGTCETYPICAQKEHEHDASCTRLSQTCGMTLHTHTDACCTRAEHAAHTEACCNRNVHTNHTTGCYDNVSTNKNVSDDDLKGAPKNPVDGQVYKGNKANKIIYINGTWYRYDGNVKSGKTAQPNEQCPGIHTHNDGNCNCARVIHTHGDGNCSYNHEEHREHTDACYDWECGATVSHVHSSACYSACTKPEHTEGSTCEHGSAENRTRYLLKIIRAKYDANIAKEWPVANNSVPGLINFAFWSGNGLDQSSRVVTMNAEWAKTKVIVDASYKTTEYQLNYWFEDPDQTAAPDTNTRKYNSTLKKYYVLSDQYTQVAYYSSGLDGWGYKTITGMKPAENGDADMSGNTANLYYNRNRWNLVFESDGTRVHAENSIPFEKPLKYYLDAEGKYIADIVPKENPVDKPANGYYFEGWYTTRECFPGTRVDFKKLSMPDSDLTLFANWAPKTHQIEFYFDSSLTTRLDEIKFPTQLIRHNEYGADPGMPGHPMEFEAVTWFYKDANGEEQTFNFAMPVKEDMKLYPKWRSSVYINYEIRYKIYDRDTNTYTDIEIAAPTYGQELYDETITIVPKGTESFYDAYRIEQNGYFPLTGSHSIIMGETQCSGGSESAHCTWDENTNTHIFTYYYVNGPKVPYTVKYHFVDENGKTTELFSDKVVDDNYKARVVENAPFKVGYKLDQAQKTLYVVYGEKNEIIFYYTKDQDASWYTVTHYVKQYGSKQYGVYEENRYVANIGKKVSGYKPVTIPGCEYVETKVSADDYIVQAGTEETPGFWMAFYYEEKPVTIKYEVMGDFGGKVSLKEETIGIAFGTAAGSTATPLDNTYRFVGWYDVQGNLLSTNAKFVPAKADGVHVAATYYAKFEHNLTSLTISQETKDEAGNVVDYSKVDPNQTFIFNIKGDGVDMNVTVHGNGSTTIDGLTVGQEYTITEITDWSWRYSCDEWSYQDGGSSDSETGNVAKITLGLDGNVTFYNIRTNNWWLDGDSWCNNIFNK